MTEPTENPAPILKNLIRSDLSTEEKDDPIIPKPFEPTLDLNSIATGVAIGALVIIALACLLSYL